MSAVLDLYDRLRHAPDEETRARVIAEAFDLLESRYPHLDYLVTVRHLSETELRLTKEIEQVRADLTKEIEQVRAELTKEIEQVRGEVKATELKLVKEIEQVRADLTKEIEQVRGEVKAIELKLTKEIEQVRADLTKEIEGVRAQVAITAAETRSSILKWSFLFWLSQFSAVMLLLWRLWPHG
uniref:Hypothetical conserved protein n=1 Tax=uncultured beta proteobacterium TaxID=86027 RepID=H5SEZ6_9PROT|nr:hypothetical conserved protein [uncultured beta proteobacterium]